MSPPLPADFRAVVVESTDTLPQAFIKAFIRFPILLLRWHMAWFNPDGSFTQDFKDRVCAACQGEDS